MSGLFVDRSRVESAHLFPLPLVAMEYFWCWDDTPAHPKRFRIVVDVSGTLDRERLETALIASAVRHPLLLCTLVNRSGTLAWSLPEQPRLGWHWGEGSWSESPFPHAWDLTQESGLRVWVNQRGDGAEICLDIHHAACDGLGIRQYLLDLFLAYDQLTADPTKAIELSRLSFERMVERGRFHRPAPSSDSRPTTLWEKIVGAYHFHFRGPVPVASPRHSPQSGSSVKPPFYFRHVFTSEQTQAIDRAQTELAARALNRQASGSQASQSTLNDAAVARFFQLLARWNRDHGRTSRNERYRILIPTDLRSLDDRRLPAANRLGFGFVVAEQAECIEYLPLLGKVHQQTQAIRNLHLGLDFVEIFAGLAKQPKLGRWLVRRPGCLATGILSNLGDSFGRHRKSFGAIDGKTKVGDLLIEGFHGFPPLRPQTSIGIGVARYAERWFTTTIIDSSKFPFDQAEELHQAWVCSWRDFVAS